MKGRAPMLLSLWMACASAGAQPAGDRALERYLEAHGLRSALIEHLDARLSSVAGPERAALAERLTRLVAEELESAPTPARRAELERRARTLLDVIPESDSLDLRLSLHRAAYTSAEQIAERWRLRLASSEEAEEARRVMSTLGAELVRLGAIAHRRVDNLERLEQSARDGADEEAIAQQLADARRQRSMAMYLSGWCMVYSAELSGQRTAALEAMPRFGWLLNAEMGKAPTLDRVPEQTLRFEHVARAALGVASAISITGDPALAMQWIGAVEAANPENADIRSFVSRLRILTLARASRWTELFELIRASRGVPASAPDATPATPLDPVVARLLAVLAFELPQGAQPAPQQALRRVAFADLVGAGQTAQVIDLAQRYGTEALGEQGFVTDYVRGMQAFRAAREAHERSGSSPDEPAGDASVASLYTHASRLLSAALRAPDAAQAGEARADALMLQASAQFFAAGTDTEALLASASLFERAAAELPASRAADAAWNRVKALRLASRHATRDRERVEELASRAVNDFATGYPRDPRTASIVLERAARAAGDEQNPELLEALLAIRPDSASYAQARRQASAMLFRAAQQAQSDGARAEALRFAEVSGPLLEADTQAALAGDADAAARAELLARQLLALLLADSVSEVALAQRAAERMESLVRAGLVKSPEVVAEFRYRQIQVALLSNDLVRAEAAVSALRAIGTPEASRFLAGADRLAYRRALSIWRQHPSDMTAARAVVINGVRVIEQLGVGDGALRDGATLGVYFAVIDAASSLARQNDDQEALQLARRLVRRVLTTHPTSGLALRRAAELAELANEPGDAAEAWRTLQSGAEIGSADWFEASFQRIRLLAASDSSEAGALLGRHFELFPDGGPSPWGERFNALRRSVGRDSVRRAEP